MKEFEVKLYDNGIREYNLEAGTIICSVCNRKKINTLNIGVENHLLYFLKGFNNGEVIFYVGKTQDIASRLKDHLKNKDFWEDVIVFSKKGDERGFYKEIEHLEKFFINKIKESSYKLKNDILKENTKNLTSSELRYIDDIHSVLEVLGFNFEKNQLTTINIEEVGMLGKTKIKDNFNEFFIKKPVKNRGFCDAKMINNNGIFTILKGSIGVKNITESFPKNNYYNERIKLIEDGVIKEYHDRIEFAEDYEYNSSSLLASIILGGLSNGNKEWRKV